MVRKGITFAEEKAQRAAEEELNDEPVEDEVNDEEEEESSGLSISPDEKDIIINDAFARTLEDPELLTKFTEIVQGLYSGDSGRWVDSMLRAAADEVRLCMQDKIAEGMTKPRAQAQVEDCKQIALNNALAYAKESAEQQGQEVAEGSVPAEDAANPGVGGGILGGGLPGLPTPSVGGVAALSSGNRNKLIKFANEKRDEFRVIEPEPKQVMGNKQHRTTKEILTKSK